MTSFDEPERTSASGGEDEQAALAEAKRRHAELTAGTVAGRSHEQVIEAARRALRCE
jgi:hypothetical protein